MTGVTSTSASSAPPGPIRRVALEEGYFTVPTDPTETPRLLGSYSAAAETAFFPRRRICPITFGPVEDRLLSPVGTLYAWTWIYQLRFGRDTRGTGGYGVGQVDLPEGPRVQARILGRFGDWNIEMPMTLDLMPVGDPLPAEPEGGGPVQRVTFCFRPTEAADVPA